MAGIMLPFGNTSNFYEFTKTILLVVVVCYLILKFYSRRPMVKACNKLPGLRLGFYYPVGHLFLISQQRIRLSKTIVSPHVYDLLHFTGYNKLFTKYGIANAWQFYIPLVTVFRADAVEVILNHSTELKKAWFYNFLHPWLGTGLLTSYDEKWKNRRKLLTSAFHFNILKDFLPVFNKQSKILVEILQNHTKDEYVDMLPIITRCSLDIICESILGREMHTQTQESSPYVKAVLALTDLVFERLVRPWLWFNTLYSLFPSGRTFNSHNNVLHDFTTKMIAERKKAKLERKASDADVHETVSDDIYKRKKRALLDLLLDEHIENNSISEAEIREEVDTFTFEGHDTTSIAMSWALYLIGLHPWIQEKIHNELDSIFDEDDREATVEDLKQMKYLECVLKESLRLYPSVAGYAREVREDLNFQGHVIPAGATCAIFPYLLHRDPEAFPNPEKFDPDRFTPENSLGRHPFAYVPFSAGPRNCIGQRFAVMEEKTVISSILRKFKVRSLDPRDKVHEMDELILRPEKGLRIQIRKRSDDFDFPYVYYRP